MKKFIVLAAMILLIAPTLAHGQGWTPDWEHAKILYFPQFAVGGGTEYLDKTRQR